jgi:hypothetical protein
VIDLVNGMSCDEHNCFLQKFKQCSKGDNIVDGNSALIKNKSNYTDEEKEIKYIHALITCKNIKKGCCFIYLKKKIYITYVYYNFFF